jgi:hypothetical protein
MSQARPDDLFEAQLLDGRRIVFRAAAVLAIVSVLEPPDHSTLIVDGREFAVVGEAAEIAQALLCG